MSPLEWLDSKPKPPVTDAIPDEGVAKTPINPCASLTPVTNIPVKPQCFPDEPCNLLFKGIEKNIFLEEREKSGKNICTARETIAIFRDSQGNTGISHGDSGRGTDAPVLTEPHLLSRWHAGDPVRERAKVSLVERRADGR